MPTVREVEDKYAVGEDFVLPDLTGLAGVARVSEPETYELSATYWDTPDLRLVRNKITLRRRTGGTDEGWHLKLPAGGPSGGRGRDEVQRPLGRRRTVPPDLAGLVLARSRGAELGPVARVETRRTVTHLLDEHGGVLAEVADDTVTPTAFDPNSGSQNGEVRGAGWREVEVELVGGDGALLLAVGERLRAAGAEPSTNVSKIATVLRTSVLGERLDAGPDLAVPAGLGKKSSAGDVVRAYLAENLEKMLDADPRVRLDVPDAVHKMRVATRRLRSTLRTFRALLDGERARDLDARLKEVAAVLGVPRDREVQLERLRARLDEQPEALILGPVQQRLDERLGGTACGTRGRAGHPRRPGVPRADRGSSRLRRHRRPAPHGGPLGPGRPPEAGAQALPAAGPALARSYDVVGRERDERLHAARKAAKRVRYAAEALLPVYGKDARRFAKRIEDVQEVLGEHQDSVVIQPLLRELGPRPRSTPASQPSPSACWPGWSSRRRSAPAPSSTTSGHGPRTSGCGSS